MKLKFVVFILMLLETLLCFSNNIYKEYNYAQVDSIARSIKYNGNLDELVSNLTKSFTAEHLKARSIYTWITANIDYDCVGLKGEKKIVYKPLEVLSSKLTVCSGYSFLFQEMCSKANLECVVITGWSKSFKKQLRKINWKNSNHAWNAVKLKGKWELIDVTWSSGHTKGSCKEYIRSFADIYFCMAPNLMILQHYPEDEKWKLGASISKEEFENLPLFYKPFFTMDIQNLNQMHKNVKKNVFGKVVFTFETSDKIESISTSDSKYEISFKKTDNSIKFKSKAKKSTFCFYINGIGIVEYLTN